MTETVFITGADKGLGLSLAGAFLKAGFRVFAGVYCSREKLGGLDSQFPAMLTPVDLDVCDRTSIERAAGVVSTLTPSLDIFINNAGVNLQDTTLMLEGLDLWDGHLEGTLQVNAFGPLRLVQQFLPLLGKGTRKLILNISSEAGSITDCTRKTEYAYCMSKAALNMAAKILQNYLSVRGFRVLALHPGWMRTDMGGPNADLHPDESAEAILNLAMAEDLPNDVIYLNHRGEPLPW